MPSLHPDVLIVEDDEPTQYFLRALCTRLGYSPLIVGDGDEASPHLDGQEEWRVLLLDLYLPRRNGFELIEGLRVKAPQLLKRMIVITAASERDIEKIRGLGLVHAVLRKPLDINELNEQMKSCAAIPQPVRRPIQRST